MGRKNVEQSPGKAPTEKDARAARLKLALKANMQRRKAQARARTASDDTTDPEAQDTPPDTTGRA